MSVAAGQLGLTAIGTISNAGAISAGATSLTSGSSLTNSGTIFGDSALSLTADSMSSSGGLASNGALTFIARDITLASSSDVQAGSVLRISATNQLNTSGNILALGAADLSAVGAFNQNAIVRLRSTGRLASGGRLLQNGSVEANGALGLIGLGIEGSGELRSSASISFGAGAGGIDYAGNIAAITGLGFVAPGTIRLAGIVGTDGVASVDADILTLDGVLTGLGGVTTRVRSVNIDSNGGLRSGGDLLLNYASLNNIGLIAFGRRAASVGRWRVRQQWYHSVWRDVECSSHRQCTAWWNDYRDWRADTDCR